MERIFANSPRGNAGLCSVVSTPSAVTDWPHPNIEGVMPNDGDLLSLLRENVADRRIRNAILVDNPHRRYGFEA